MKRTTKKITFKLLKRSKVQKTKTVRFRLRNKTNKNVAIKVSLTLSPEATI
jgi:hypothetical protein